MLQLPAGRDASLGEGRAPHFAAPSPGANPSLPTCRRVLPGFRGAVGSRGQGAARLRSPGI